MDNPAGDKRFKPRPMPSATMTQFVSQWHAVAPNVYRYEDQRWIDDFFDSGKLRLSTFSKFSTYQDEVRGDTREGKSVCEGRTSSGKSIFVAQAQGLNAAVLCTSHSLSHRLRKSFDRNSAFEICSTTSFALEIARQLPGFRQGLEGSCIYRRDAAIYREIDIDFEKYRLPDGNFDMQFIQDAGHALGGHELVLLKRAIYSDQREYRFLWELDYLSGEYIDVIAPNARQYCRRVEDGEWEA